jgi:acyl-CoA synthetase (NDP forming)
MAKKDCAFDQPAERPPPLRNLLNPRSVAIIGASESPAKFGGRMTNFLVKHGFKGTILPINPNAGEILGITAYASIGDAPGPIDVALLASLISHARDLGTGFTVAVSVGNQADLEICSFVEYFIENQATHAICAYKEGLKDG